jgi:hypothetical protein
MPLRCIRCGTTHVSNHPCRWKPCPECGQPMKPKGIRKKRGEFDHAMGCPRAPKKHTRAK